MENKGSLSAKGGFRSIIPQENFSAFYAFYFGEPVSNFKDLLLNFNYAAGHLWFVYMLIGIYLIIPMLSPWAESGQSRLQFQRLRHQFRGKL